MQYEQRQCLLENDAKVYAEQLEKLQEYQQKLDEVWRSSRWISNIASDARHRQQNCSIQLDRILVMPFQRPSDDPEDWRQVRSPCILLRNYVCIFSIHTSTGLQC